MPPAPAAIDPPGSGDFHAADASDFHAADASDFHAADASGYSPEEARGAAPAGSAESFAATWAEFAAALRRARSRAADQPDARLTAAQFHLLSALSGGGELGVGELARAAGVSSPTATRMLDGLERDGLITREPSAADRRRTAVRTTAAGAEAVAETQRRFDAARERIYAGLSPDERVQAEHLLGRLAEALESL